MQTHPPAIAPYVIDLGQMCVNFEYVLQVVVGHILVDLNAPRLAQPRPFNW